MRCQRWPQCPGVCGGRNARGFRDVRGFRGGHGVRGVSGGRNFRGFRGVCDNILSKKKLSKILFFIFLGGGCEGGIADLNRPRIRTPHTRITKSQNIL
jgi:hypothetical protein